MSLDILRRTVRGKFVIIDSQFPQKEPMGFRNTEINEYLKRITDASVYTMHPMSPDSEAWFNHGYGISKDDFIDNKSGYLRNFPQNKKRIHYLETDKKYDFELAYSFFLAETYVLLPFYEKHKIPFIFMLYPGGAFGLDNDASDNMLQKIFQSKYFKGVIVSQKLTRDYLINKKLCAEKKISFVYGGFVQFEEKELQPKKYYGKNKATFDICFVGAKYTNLGIDKGYDVFIKTAKILAKYHDAIRFHVVGNFDKEDIDVRELRDKIIFYGYQKPSFFTRFYSTMDMMVSPNRPYKLYKGNFDGFPLGIDAGYCGVGMFVSDPLKMNSYFINNKDIVIIPTDPKTIAQIITKYMSDLDSLYDLSKSGEKLAHKLFSIDHQISERLNIFNSIYNREYGRELK